MSRVLSVALLVLAWPLASAWGQTNDVSHRRTIFSEGPLPITWLHPTAAEGRINCNYGEADCKPFNLAACADPTLRPISVSLPRTPTMPTTNAVEHMDLIAWVQNSDIACAYELESTSKKVLVATTVYPPFLYTQAMRFPDDVGAPLVGGTLDVRTVLNMFDACTTPVTFATWRICIGIDLPPDGKITPPGASTTVGTINRDVVYSLLFQVGTKEPPQPSGLTVTSLKSRCKVSVPIDDSMVGNIYQVEVRSRPNDASVEPNCLDWPEGFHKEMATLATSTASVDIEVAGDNGTQYAYCARTIDAVGNPSKFSAITLQMPHDECDMIECYPESVDLQTGFCGAALTPTASLVVGLAAAWRAWRRRRTT